MSHWSRFLAENVHARLIRLIHPTRRESRIGAGERHTQGKALCADAERHTGRNPWLIPLLVASWLTAALPCRGAHLLTATRAAYTAPQKGSRKRRSHRSIGRTLACPGSMLYESTLGWLESVVVVSLACYHRGEAPQ